MSQVVDYFVMDFDNCWVDDILNDIEQVEEKFDVNRIWATKTSYDCWHVVVLLEQSAEFDMVVELLKKTNVDRDYLDKVEEKGMFFETEENLERSGIL